MTQATFSKDYWLWAILAIAFVLRMFYLVELRHSPFYSTLILDLAAYDTWGQRIARGEWLGSHVFYQDPLYPYFLGVIYFCFGHWLAAVYFVQIILGTLSCLLVYWLGRELFNRPAGLLAAGMAAIYRPFIFYDVQIEKSILAVLLVLVSSVLLVWAQVQRRKAMCYLAGLALGLLVLVRGNYLLLVPVVFFALAFGGRELELLQRLRPAWFLLLGTSTVLLLTLVRNYVVGRDLVLTTSQAGQNFFIGNNPDNLTGMYRAPDFVRADPKFEESDFAREAERLSGRPLKASEVSSFWLKKGLEFIEENPVGFLKLLAYKAALFWNNYEIPDNLDIYFFSRYSSLMRFPLPSFGIVASLAAAGMITCVRDFKKLWPLYVLVLGYFLSVIPFYVFSRYRLPIVPVLMVFAARAFLETIEFFKRKEFGKTARVAIVAILAGAAIHAPLLNAYNPSAIDNLGAILIRMGDLREAETLFREVLARRPDYADAHNNLGVVLLRRGEAERAVEEFRNAISLKPRSPNSYVNLGLGLTRAGEPIQARNAFAKALEQDPANAEALAGLGLLQRAAGEHEAALELFRRAAALAPESAEARNNLGIALLSRGEVEEALHHLSAAANLRDEFAEAHFNRAICLERLKKPADAIESYRHALARRPDYAEAYNNLGNLLAETGDKEGALAAYQNFLKYWKGDQSTREAVQEEIKKLSH